MRHTSRLLRLAWLLVGALPALAAEGGAVTGRVEVTPGRYRDETVVYLKEVPGEHAPVTHEMDQKSMRFRPMILAITVGDTVAFLNHDGVEHNVYSPDQEAFELGNFQTGDQRAHRFAAPGVYRVLCRIHPEMLGYVFVGQNPYAAPLDLKGRYRIEGVPAGTWRLVVWNAHAREVERSVTIQAGQTVELDLEVKK